MRSASLGSVISVEIRLQCFFPRAKEGRGRGWALARFCGHALAAGRAAPAPAPAPATGWWA
jgi:hypothetical protein